MLNRRGNSKTDTLVKLILIFFISLLSFSVGTFVGKQFSDSRHKLASLENEVTNHEEGERDTASIPTDSLEVKPDQALTDEDINKLSEEFSNTEKDNLADLVEKKGESTNKAEAKAEAPAHGKEAAPGAHDKKAETAKNDHGDASHDEPVKAKVVEQIKKVQTAAERVAAGKEPTEPVKKVESRIPSSLPGSIASSTIGKYTVQVSSHQSEAEAEKHAAELKAKGFSAFYVAAEIKGATWYRVNVGLFTNREEANTFMADFKKQANVQSALVQKIVK